MADFTHKTQSYIYVWVMALSIVRQWHSSWDGAHICRDPPECCSRLSLVFWWGPLYSSCGCCGAWCMFGWKQWMHHVEWIFASLRAWWTITQTRFCSGRISITTLASPYCVWLCHPAVSCPVVKLHDYHLHVVGNVVTTLEVYRKA